MLKRRVLVAVVSAEWVVVFALAGAIVWALASDGDSGRATPTMGPALARKPTDIPPSPRPTSTPIPPEPFVERPYVRGIAVLTGGVLRVAVNRLIVETRDEGAHWTILGSLDAPVYDLAFPAPLEGWAVTDEGLHHSSDGGRTWSLKIPARAVAWTYAVGRRVQFANQANGWVTLPREQHLRTYDGGQSWEEFATPCKEAQATSFYTFYDALDAWLICGGQSSRTFVSDDGGSSWEPRSEWHHGATHLSTVFALDAQRVWLGRGSLWATTSGFQTGGWIELPLDVDQGISDVRFLTPDLGYVVAGGSVLMRTLDGGQSWCTILNTRAIALGFRPPRRCGAADR